MSRREFFRIYLRQNRKNIGTFFFFCAVFLCIFLLYDLPMGAVVYPTLICSVVGTGLLGHRYSMAYQKHRELIRVMELSSELMEHFPKKITVDDWDYQTVIEHLREEESSLKDQLNIRYNDMMEYYTVWVHQIKTPIASMRLMLQNEDSDQARRLSEELSRIEQYVEMVLVYLRLDSESKDHVFRKCDLNQIVRGEVKKFAGQFIRRKIGLQYEPLCCEVLTDEKWLAFVVEQVISNALKYTEEGESTISLEKPQILCIRDTGIGIAPEDLPRIFEKGYTGYNGRADKKASGIGLYLCRRICTQLGHRIWAESEPSVGTVIKIDLEREDLQVE